jgi:hypothetical protein
MPYGVLPIRGGITELINDVLAGPGSGVQAALVVGLQGFAVSPAAPAVGEVLTWTGLAWTPTAASVGFRAAPKYVVGNVLAGDTATPYNADGFLYFPDPGDGTGIEAALGAAALLPGDVHVRPGTYDLAAGAAVAPLSVPAGVSVVGAGDGTVIVAKTTGDQGIFSLAGNNVVRDVQISVPAAAPGAGVGSTAVILVQGNKCTITRVKIEYSTEATSALRTAINIVSDQCVLSDSRIEHLGGETNLSLIEVAANRCVLSSNVITPTAGIANTGITVFGERNICQGNNFGQAVPSVGAAIVLQVDSDNNIVIGNICLTAPAVNNLGTGNEVAHNI